MKVLVTGATGVYGRGVVERLVRAGHEVVAMARNAPRALPAGVTFAQGDVAEYADVERAMQGCEVVAHMAFVVTPLKSEEETRRINLGGTQNVLDAIAKTGARRLVFVSSAMGYGANPDNPPLFTEQHEQRPAPDYIYGTCKKEAEALIRASGVEAVMARTAVTVGRNADNLIVDIFGAPAIVGIKGVDSRYQLIHEEDVARFVAFACEQGPPGPVNVAPPDFLSLREIAEILGKPFIEVSEAQATKGVEFAWEHDLVDITPGEIAGVSYLPRMAVDRLRDEWGFECAWSTAEGIYDLRRAVAGTTFAAKRRIALPWRVRYPQVHPGEFDEVAGGASFAGTLAGELDTPVGLEHPSYRALARDRAPIAPLPLTTHLYVLRAALKGALAAVGAESPGPAAATSIGHRLYVNEDALQRLFALPAWRRRMLSAGYAREVGRLCGWANRTLEMATDPDARSDASLEAVLTLTRDELAWLWSLCLLGAALDGDRDVTFDELIGAPSPSPAPARAARSQAEAMVLRLRHALKGLLVERARRVGVDVAQLTWDELLTPPDDTASLVERRSAEHARLAATEVPLRVAAVAASSAVHVGDEVPATLPV